ncbi:MAG: hypothetical protein AB7O48_15365 [Cyclobacteriaceae bacterium]
MRQIIFVVAVVVTAPFIGFSQNSFPSTGTTILNSGGNQSLIIRDGRSGINWNYIQWDFSDGSRDWLLGRRATDGNFTLWRNGLNEVWTVANNGNMGLGTISPNSKLHIYKSTTGNSDASIAVDGPANSERAIVFRDNGSDAWWFGRDNTGDMNTGIGFWRSGVGFALALRDNGNVGIGTSNPQNKLDVNGTMHAKEVKVDLNGWPDYVFNESYNLTPLSELKEYVNTNKHLPGVPIAKDVEENGVMLGEMNKVLLQKLEEVTLYLIELKEENEDLKSRLERIEKRIN